jgi:hypothetical protein
MGAGFAADSPYAGTEGASGHSLTAGSRARVRPTKICGEAEVLEDLAHRRPICDGSEEAQTFAIDVLRCAHSSVLSIIAECCRVPWKPSRSARDGSHWGFAPANRER